MYLYDPQTKGVCMSRLNEDDFENEPDMAECIGVSFDPLDIKNILNHDYGIEWTPDQYMNFVEEHLYLSERLKEEGLRLIREALKPHAQAEVGYVCEDKYKGLGVKKTLSVGWYEGNPLEADSFIPVLITNPFKEHCYELELEDDNFKERWDKFIDEVKEMQINGITPPSENHKLISCFSTNAYMEI